MGNQAVANGAVLKLIDPATGQLLMIPSGGGDLTPVGTRGSANPMWAPANVGNSNNGGANNNNNGGNNTSNNNGGGSSTNGGNSESSNSSSAPSMEFIRKPGTASFILRAANSKADPDASFLLQSSSDLKNWNSSLTVTGKMANSGITVANGGRHAYYRLVKQN
ncbi:MAG: hypothetical protein ACI9R3_002939 [Verrucomicrobiales bacterium]|jgi:hypothetical protein